MNEHTWWLNVFILSLNLPFFASLFYEIWKQKRYARVRKKYSDLIACKILNIEQCSDLNTLISCLHSREFLSYREVVEAEHAISRSKVFLPKFFHTDCKFYNQSDYLHCAVNPDGCENCHFFELTSAQKTTEK